MKLCYRCNIEKPLSEFNKNIKRKDGVQVYCTDCMKAYAKERYNNPEVFKRRKMNAEENSKKRKASSRKWYLKSVYNITLEEYQELCDKKDNRCWICEKQTRYFLHVDHDHSCCPGTKSCGKCIRGLLCHACNSLLGHSRDNVDILRSAILYLDS